LKLETSNYLQKPTLDGPAALAHGRSVVFFTEATIENQQRLR
jgi:hypothetical protein